MKLHTIVARTHMRDEWGKVGRKHRQHLCQFFVNRAKVDDADVLPSLSVGRNEHIRQDIAVKVTKEELGGEPRSHGKRHFVPTYAGVA